MFSFLNSIWSSNDIKDSTSLMTQKINFLECGFQQPSSIPSLTDINGDNVIYTVNELLNRYTVRKGLTTNSNMDTTSSAKDIINTLQNNTYIKPNIVLKGFYWIWNIHNRTGNGYDLQIQGGTNVIINGGVPYITISDNTIKAIQIQITNVEEGSEEVFLTPLN